MNKIIKYVILDILRNRIRELEDDNGEAKAARPETFPSHEPQTDKQKNVRGVITATDVNEKLKEPDGKKGVTVEERAKTKPHVCDFPGCGKAFEKANQLRGHKISHRKDVTASQKPQIKEA